jgi:hypothetical protein
MWILRRLISPASVFPSPFVDSGGGILIGIGAPFPAVAGLLLLLCAQLGEKGDSIRTQNEFDATGNHGRQPLALKFTTVSNANVRRQLLFPLNDN